MALLYHLVPRPLIGSTLYPLCRLRDSQPELYAACLQKYAGREALLQQPIFYLDCSRHEVVNLSPVHPARIREALVEVGYAWRPRAWFELDPSALGFNEENSVIYFTGRRKKGDFKTTQTQFEPYSPDRLTQLTRLPQMTVNHYQSAQNDGQPILLFHGVPHILHRGSIDISMARQIMV